MPPLQFVTQPNNVPTLAPNVATAPQNKPALSPQVKSAPPAPQPAQLPVQNAPTEPQQSTLPVTDKPQNQQQAISVQVPSMITGIQTALNRGADPNSVLQAIGQQHAEMQPAIQEALGRGASPNQALQQIVQQYSGVTSDSQDTTPQHTGFVQSLIQFLARPLVEPLVHAGARIGEAIGSIANPAAGEQDQTVHLPVLGDFNIPAQNKTSFKQELGHAAQTVSLGIPNPVSAGAVYGAGNALKENKGVVGTATQAGIGALGGKLGDAAVAGISKVLSKLNEGPAAILINSLIKPLEKEFRFGKNPGLGVAQEKIVANSLPDLEKQVTQKLSDVGQQISDHVSAPELQTKTADYSAVIKPFDDAISEAAKGGANNQALVTRLQNAKEALTQEFEIRQGQITPKINAKTTAPITKDLTALNPVEGNSLKQDIGKLRSWKGTPSEDTTYNQAVIKAYRAANDIVETQPPGTTQLNSRYPNLLSPHSTIERRTSVEARQNTFGLFDKLGLGEAALALARGAFHTAAASILLPLANHTLGSPPFKTRVSSALSSVPEISTRLVY